MLKISIPPKHMNFSIHGNNTTIYGMHIII